MATPMKEEASQSWIAAGGALLCFFYSCPDSQLLFWKDLLSLLLSCRQPFVLAFESMLDSLLSLLYSIMMSIWMYELVQKTLANTETLLCAPKNDYHTTSLWSIVYTMYQWHTTPLCCIHLASFPVSEYSALKVFEKVQIFGEWHWLHKGFFL